MSNHEGWNGDRVKNESDVGQRDKFENELGVKISRSRWLEDKKSRVTRHFLAWVTGLVMLPYLREGMSKEELAVGLARRG